MQIFICFATWRVSFCDDGRPLDASNLSFTYQNPLSRAARTAGGVDVAIRVIAIGDEGRDHLKILKKIARGKPALHSTNHALPMFQQLVFEDIVFGVFPKIGARIFDMVGRWAKNSVGDVLEMVMQMLEVPPVLPNSLIYVSIWHYRVLPSSMTDVSPIV